RPYLVLRFEFLMPKNQLTKEELKVRVLKLKDKLYSDYSSNESKELVGKYLNEVIDIINEYRT
ncbi:MAG: hypothetical protein O2787_02995, partial [Cyanobacteria bacterium]|nr:hypothetical protein [Cyanobacteriota bacterium]